MVRTTGFLQHCDSAPAWTSQLSMHVPATHARPVIITRMAQMDGPNGIVTAVLRLVLAACLTVNQRSNSSSQVIVLWKR